MVITARPSYSRIKTALIELQNNQHIELQIVVAASALLDRYGTASKFIEEDGFTISAKVFNVLEGGNLTVQAKTTGLGILELSTVFENLKPDAIVTIADRYETMATAIAASYMNIPLVHIQGGEVTGNIDEKVRHAITKLSDLHLVSSEEARLRVIKMGEMEQNVITTGCPSIDLARLSVEQERSFDPIKKYGGVGNSRIDLQNFIIVLQHPVTNEFDEARYQIETTLSAVKETDISCFWFWPNVDAGSDATSKGIRVFREKNPDSKIHFFKNFEPEDFLQLLVKAKCIIGNSSVGIREAAYLGVPVVNIGTRQSGRERASNVLDVHYNKDEIKAAIIKQMSVGKFPSSFIYGDGYAGERIASVLSTHPLTFSKQISY